MLTDVLTKNNTQINKIIFIISNDDVAITTSFDIIYLLYSVKNHHSESSDIAASNSAVAPIIFERFILKNANKYKLVPTIPNVAIQMYVNKTMYSIILYAVIGIHSMLVIQILEQIQPPSLMLQLIL